MPNIQQRGFTIVELLIVVVIIGILAAIVVVAYNGITSRAHHTAVLNDLASIGKKLELYKVENGAYPTSVGQLVSANFTVTKGSYDDRNNMYYRVDSQGRWYAIGAITQNTAHCLESGRVVDNAGSGCNTSANTANNVLVQATAAGVDPGTVTTWASNGYSGDTDVWASWLP